jgi:hypothetical protein
MKDLTEAEKQQLADEVRREFPDDEVMQQVHYVRLLHHAQTRGFSPEERVRFFGPLQKGSDAVGQ